MSNRINPDGTPIRTEVWFAGSAANDNLSMNLRITCQMSALGHGNDLAPEVGVLIRNATASSFDIIPNYSQTLTNNRGYTCNVRTVTETATYTPLSDTTIRLFGLDFTGTCMGSSTPTPSPTPTGTTIRLTLPQTNSSYSILSPIYSSWSITGAPENSQVILVNTLITPYATVTDGTYGSNRLIQLSPGDSTGSHQWLVGPTYWNIPGVFEMTAYVRQCNSGGCDRANVFGAPGQGIDYAQSATVRYIVH
ncbi:MAG: hypothetical protein IPJ68_03955 [Candidatus Moraniibacteriota bacterium]|nr:MAG: hypothetical protein IPJ68_03955 [Candidatus Moranbacteria bacterium]